MTDAKKPESAEEWSKRIAARTKIAGPDDPIYASGLVMNGIRQPVERLTGDALKQRIAEELAQMDNEERQYLSDLSPPKP